MHGLAAQLGLPAVGGVLIGGASLRAADFTAVLAQIPKRLRSADCGH